jgi:hypothetical protein
MTTKATYFRDIEYGEIFRVGSIQYRKTTSSTARSVSTNAGIMFSKIQKVERINHVGN